MAQTNINPRSTLVPTAVFVVTLTETSDMIWPLHCTAMSSSSDDDATNETIQRLCWLKRQRFHVSRHIRQMINDKSRFQMKRRQWQCDRIWRVVEFQLFRFSGIALIGFVDFCFDFCTTMLVRFSWQCFGIRVRRNWEFGVWWLQ